MITLHHTQVPAHDKEATAKVFAEVFGLRYNGIEGHLARIRVNDSLTIDFADKTDFQTHHYAFQVTEAEFDAILDRIRGKGIPFGSVPRSQDMQVNPRRGGRTIYFLDQNGHNLEVLTA